MQGHSGDTVVGLQESQRVPRGAEKLTRTDTESEESHNSTVLIVVTRLVTQR